MWQLSYITTYLSQHSTYFGGQKLEICKIKNLLLGHYSKNLRKTASIPSILSSSLHLCQEA